MTRTLPSARDLVATVAPAACVFDFDGTLVDTHTINTDAARATRATLGLTVPELADLFTTIVAREHVARLEPAPDAYLLAAHRLVVPAPALPGLREHRRGNRRSTRTRMTLSTGPDRGTAGSARGDA
ncbi:hypothetical protein [Streptomyces sp. NRRL B-24572]|uniref:hypothetical protein n=1 Tax=Streptomyces sp. NRRL B-24572 TaxID=1962156 RepID=UPI00117FF330|nr:hypothetical protein [Streptomyces sp. NRRL B-24572]